MKVKNFRRKFFASAISFDDNFKFFEIIIKRFTKIFDLFLFLNEKNMFISQ